MWVLDTGRIQLVQGDLWPTPMIPPHIQEFVHLFSHKQHVFGTSKSFWPPRFASSLAVKGFVKRSNSHKSSIPEAARANYTATLRHRPFGECLALSWLMPPRSCHASRLVFPHANGNCTRRISCPSYFEWPVEDFSIEDSFADFLFHPFGWRQDLRLRGYQGNEK